MFTSAVHAAPPHTNRMDIGSSWEGFALPDPPKGAGPGCAGLRPASAEVWGNPVSPPPSPRAYVHGSRPCGSAAQRRNEHTFVLGRAAPSQTLPQVGEWEKPGFPIPLRGGGVGKPGFPMPLFESLCSRQDVRGRLPAGRGPSTGCCPPAAGGLRGLRRATGHRRREKGYAGRLRLPAPLHREHRGVEQRSS